MFNVSDKGGIGDSRNVNLNLDELKSEMLVNKNNLFDLQNGKLIIR